MRFHLDVKECSFGADSRIHDNDVKGLAGEIGNRGGKKERRVRKILRRDLMAQVDNAGTGIDPEDDPLHGRNVGGFLAKICGERNERVRHDFVGCTEASARRRLPYRKCSLARRRNAFRSRTWWTAVRKAGKSGTNLAK